MLKEKRNKKNEWLCYLTHERSYCAIKRLTRKKLIRAFFWEEELSNYSCLLILSDAKEITVIVFPRLQTPTHSLSLSLFLSLSHQLSQMYTHVRMHKHTHKLQHSHTHTQTRTKSSLQTISEMVYLLCVTSKSDQTLFPFPQPSIHLTIKCCLSRNIFLHVRSNILCFFIRPSSICSTDDDNVTYVKSPLGVIRRPFSLPVTPEFENNVPAAPGGVS